MNYRVFLILLALGFLLPLRAADATVTDAEALEFSRKLEATLQQGDGAGYKSLMDFDAFGNRVMNGIEVDAKQKRDFMAGFINGFQSDNSLVNALKNGASIKFLRIARRDGMTCGLFRFLPADGGGNYFYYALAKSPAGIRIVDLLPLSSGEWMTTSSRQMALPHITEANKGLLDKLIGTENEFVKNFPHFTKATQLFKQQNFTGAMKELDQMPESVKKMKIVCLMRIGAAQQIGTKEHQAVLEEVSKWYGNDPAMNFTMVDAYFLRNDYVNARKMIDSVDQTLGGDPYMEVLRGNSYFIEKNYAKAVECGERAIKAEPMLAPSYDVVLESHLNQKNYGALLETLKVFSKTFKVEPDAIANNPAYAAFAASEEWKKYKAEKK